MTILQLDNGVLTPKTDGDSAPVALSDWIVSKGSVKSIVVSNDQAIVTLPSLDSVEEIILEFPSFADGRAYTQARQLRERLGFEGRIRASGDVLCDQVQYMARVGFDVFDIGNGSVEEFRGALKMFSQFYQHAADNREPVWSRRLAIAIAA